MGKALLYWAGYATLCAWMFQGVRDPIKGYLVRNQVFKLALTGLLCFAALVSVDIHAKDNPPRVFTDSLTVGELSPSGRETYYRIRQGGPFPFEKDGTVFGNRERLLPLQKRGYYREYTVKPQGSGNRGIQRIVCGGAPKAPDACYYTADHYASFRKIVP